MNMHVAVNFLLGLLFGLGLLVSGMTDPGKVQGFLDVAGRWDPSLALVMGGGLLVSVPGFARVRRRRPDACAAALYQQVDARLLIGGALFGIGWGIAGYCPGPALANLAHAGEAVAFVVAMLAGSQLARLLPISR